MKMRFLCETHRAELHDKPALAINCWQNGFDTGQFLHEQQQWREALPHLGCAFETAEILISTHAIYKHHAYEVFTCSALLLADNLMRLGLITDSQAACRLSINRLERELNQSPIAQHSVVQQLDLLYQRARDMDQLNADINESTHVQQHQEDSTELRLVRAR